GPPGAGLIKRMRRVISSTIRHDLGTRQTADGPVSAGGRPGPGPRPADARAGGRRERTAPEPGKIAVRSLAIPRYGRISDLGKGVRSGEIGGAAGRTGGRRALPPDLSHRPGRHGSGVERP